MKRSYLHLCLTSFISFLVLSGCQSASRRDAKPHPKPPNDYQPSKLQKITNLGTNRFPSLSEDHTKMLYVSSHRPKHHHTQIYLLDFETQQNKRLTYQNGKIANPQFAGNTQSLIYESTTDADKELPQIIKLRQLKNRTTTKNFKEHSVLQWLLPIENFEIYKSDLNGQKIERLTSSSNYDGGTQLINKQELLFSSQKRDIAQLQLLQFNKRKKVKTLLTTEHSHQLQAQLHVASQRIAWMEVPTHLNSSRILIKHIKKKENPPIVIESNSFHFASPVWHPSGEYLLLTSNKNNSNNFELFVFDFKSNCLKQLTYLNTHEIDPAFSPDGRHIYFSSNLQSNFDIYRMKFNPPLSCPNKTNTAKL